MKGTGENDCMNGVEDIKRYVETCREAFWQNIFQKKFNNESES